MVERNRKRRRSSYKFKLSAQDHRDLATIQKLFGDRERRGRAECITIGSHIDQFIRRYESEHDIPWGQWGRFMKAQFGTNGAYHARFRRLFLLQEAFREADPWYLTSAWKNPYPFEPMRSCALLTEFAVAHRPQRSEGENSKKPLTKISDNVTQPRSMVMTGDCRVKLHGVASQSAQACVTSPPYYLMRDYESDDQIGLEATPGNYIRTLVVDVMSQVHRILRDDGVLIVVMADRHASKKRDAYLGWGSKAIPAKGEDDLPAGNMMLLPSRFASAMVRTKLWVHCQEVVWRKTRVTESAGTRRPTFTHEIMMMFVKARPNGQAMKYKYHSDHLMLPRALPKRIGRNDRLAGKVDLGDKPNKDIDSVWPIPSQPVLGGVAAFPQELVRRWLLLLTEEDDLVIDPFTGTGTTGIVCKAMGRRFLGIEVNSHFAERSRQRIEDAPEKAEAETIEATRIGRLFQDARASVKRLLEPDDLTDDCLLRIAGAVRKISPWLIDDDNDDDLDQAEAAD